MDIAIVRREVHPAMWMVCLAAVVLAFVAGCGGGGGGGGAPLTLSGDVFVPEGTSRQAGAGYALANATVKGYIWPDLSNPIAQTTTDSNGHYVMALPESAVGKDIVIVATKQVGDKTVRVATVSPDIPAEGRQGVNLDAVTTFALEEVARIREQEGLSDLSPGGVATVMERLRERFSNWSGDLTQVLPPQIGGGLDEAVQGEVQSIVAQHKDALKGSTGNPDVDQARSMVQMMRDMMGNVVGSGQTEASSIETALNLTESALDAQLATAEAFGRRVDVMMNVLGQLDGHEPGEYRLLQNQWGDRWIERVGDIAGGKTWKVTSQISDDSNGMVVTVTVQNAIEGGFRFDPAAGKYTVTATKTGADYQMTLTPTVNETNKTGSLSASLNLQDSALSQPLTFNGTLNVTFAAMPSSEEEPKFTSATFNGTLGSQFGSAQVTNLRVEFDPDSSAEDSLKRITLQSLQAQTTARPLSISVQDVNIPFQKLHGGGIAPTTQVTIKTVQVTGRDENNKPISLTISDVTGIFTEYVDNGMGSGVLKSLQGKLNFTSDRLTLSGEVSGTWNNPVPFHKVSSAGHYLSTFPEGTIRIKGNMTPNIGKPAAVDITITSSPKATTPKVTATGSFSYGSESISISVDLPLREDSDGVHPAGGTIQMTHSPSGMKVHVDGGDDEPPAGTIKKADGTKVADIGEARRLGVAELGGMGIVKYVDGTFETLQSILP